MAGVMRAAVAAGCVGAVVAGGAGYFLLHPPSATEAADKPVKLVELIGAKYPMGQTAEALEAPQQGAPDVTRVRQGTEVQVVGIVAGDGWYQLELPDKRLAYVPVGAIPAAASPPAAPAAAAPAPAATPPAPAPAAAASVTPVPPPPAAQVPPAQTAAVAPAAPPPDSVPPPPAPGEQPSIPVPPVVTFSDAHDVMRVVNPTAVYLKPDRQAPQAYPVGVGTVVYVIARSTDGNWAWVNTADNAQAYIPTSDIAP